MYSFVMGHNTLAQFHFLFSSIRTKQNIEIIFSRGSAPAVTFLNFYSEGLLQSYFFLLHYFLGRFRLHKILTMSAMQFFNSIILQRTFYNWRLILLKN